MTGFILEDSEPLSLDRAPAIADMYALSPFVWKEGAEYWMMLRIVPDEPNPADKIARIHFGLSNDGLHFAVDEEPSLAPGPSADDVDGCEDPSVAQIPGGYCVYYTGWNETEKEGALMRAKGPHPRRLSKAGVALESVEGRRNPKEATLIQTREGDWRLFFEFADRGASRIGVARSDLAEGPWRVLDPLCAARPDQWDSWHVSTGPVWQAPDGPPIMFYNGADRHAHWRIGWIALDPACTRIIERCEGPLIIPPPPEGDATDIAFAASCIDERIRVHLYYSVADKNMFRATLRPTAS